MKDSNKITISDSDGNPVPVCNKCGGVIVIEAGCACYIQSQIESIKKAGGV